MSALNLSAPRTPRLDEIATRWSLFRQAHFGSADHSSAARNAFVLLTSGIFARCAEFYPADRVNCSTLTLRAASRAVMVRRPWSLTT